MDSVKLHVSVTLGHFNRRRMKSRFLTGVLVAAGLLMLTQSILAHHGTGISYDNSKTVTLKGVVTRFAFTNPHSQLYFDVTDDKGNLVHWAAELNPPGVLSKGGWTRHTI